MLITNKYVFSLWMSLLAFSVNHPKSFNMGYVWALKSAPDMSLAALLWILSSLSESLVFKCRQVSVVNCVAVGK